MMTLHNGAHGAILTDMSNCTACDGFGWTENFHECPNGCASSITATRGWQRGMVPDAPAPRTGGATKGAPKQVKIATVKQVAYLNSLIEARDPANEVIIAAKLVVDYNMAMSVASKWIDTLRAMPAASNAAATSVRTNNYAGTCKYCGGKVAERAGRIAPKTSGKGWDTMHLDGECPTSVPAEAPVVPCDEHKRGDVHVIGGEYYRVHIAQRSGYPYAVKAVVISEAEWDADTLVRAGEVEWEIARGFITKMNDSNRATATESAAFGHMVGRCCFCSHEIDTPESVKAGYGPTCAVKYGLPWG